MTRFRSGWLAPVAVAAIFACAALLLTGVRVSELLLFIGYELGFALVPGMVLHALVVGNVRRPVLERLVLGYALGLVIELAAFTLTAALGHRGWLALYPLPFYIGGGIAFATGRWKPPSTSLGAGASRGLAWVGATVAVVAVVWIALGFFISNPLARSVESVAYSQDLVFHIGLAAEAKHQWPINDPNVAGDPLRYHTFAHRDLAAISQVTGIPLDVLLLRLWPIAVLLAISGGALLVTRRIGGSARTGLLAVGLLLFAGEVEVDTKLSAPFLGGALFARLESPGFLFGTVFFLGALYVLLDVLRLPAGNGAGADAGMEGRSRARSLVLLAILLAGASGAKASVLPVLLGGVGIFAVGELAFSRRVRPGAIAAGALLLVVMAVSYVALFRGNSGGLDTELLSYGRLVTPTLPSGVGRCVGQLGLAGMFAPLVGIFGLFAVRGWRLPAAHVFPLCIFLASLAAFSVFSAPGVSQQYFLLYGYVALIPLSALGASESWCRIRGDRGQKLRWLAIGIAVMLVASVAGALILRSVSDPQPTGPLIAAWSFIAIAIGTAAVIVWRRFGGRGRWSAIVGLAIPLILFVAVLDYPTDTGSRLITRWSDGDPAWHESVPGQEGGITRGLRDGLLWVRDHTPESSTIAVNNMFISPGFARYFYYGAFAERPTYVSGWQYSERGFVELEGKPLPEELVSRVQASWAAALGNPAALDALANDGVRYLVVDKVNGQYADTAKLDPILKPVFSNDAVAVYDLSKL